VITHFSELNAEMVRNLGWVFCFKFKVTSFRFQVSGFKFQVEMIAKPWNTFIKPKTKLGDFSEAELLHILKPDSSPEASGRTDGAKRNKL
jgi:hypothetical protein